MKQNVDSIDLNGKVALVTSMATVIGFEIAKTLVKAGAVVHVVDPDHDRCRLQVSQLRELGKAVGHVVNLQDGVALAHFADLLCEQLPELHLLVSNERVARSETSSAIFATAALERYQLLGDLCLLHDLLECLSCASTAADPARVVVVGDFPGLGEFDNGHRTSSKSAKPLSHAKGIAQRFVNNKVNLNFIDLCQGSDADVRPATPEVLGRLISYLSPAAVQTRGEVAQIAGVMVGAGDAMP